MTFTVVHLEISMSSDELSYQDLYFSIAVKSKEKELRLSDISSASDRDNDCDNDSDNAADGPT